MRSLKWMSVPVLLLVAQTALGVPGASAQALAPGAKMPAAEVQLLDVQGRQAQLMSLRGDRGTVVVFWSNECPWVSKVEDRLQQLAQEYEGKGFSFVLVNANDPVAFPKEGAEESRKRAQAGQYAGRYVLDAQAQVARAFGAERTPHVFLFDEDDVLVYMGAIDDSPGDPGNVQQQYLRQALDAISVGAKVPMPQTKAFGCTVRLSSR